MIAQMNLISATFRLSCFQVKAGAMVVKKEVTGPRGSGAGGVAALTAEAMIVVALTVGVMIVVALTKVEEEEGHPLVWGKSESLPLQQVH